MQLRVAPQRRARARIFRPRWNGTRVLTFDASSSGGVSAATSLTVAHTITTRANRLLLVSVASSITVNVTGITFDGVALTPVTGGSTSVDVIQIEFWYLIAPNTGTHDIVVTNDHLGTMVLGAESYSGADQTTPFGTVATATGTSTTPSVTVTSAPGQYVQDGVVYEFGGGAAVVGSDQIAEWGVSSGAVLSVGSREGGATSTVMSWTITSTPWASVGIPIRPIGSGGTTTSVNLDGTVTPAGVLTKTTTKSLVSSTTPSGSLLKTIAKLFTSSTTPSGSLTKTITKVFTSSTTPSGVLSVVRGVFLSLTGSTTPTGSLLKTTTKSLVGSTTPSGALIKTTTKVLTSSTTPAGSLTKTIFKRLTSSTTPAGVLTVIRGVFLSLVGSITPTGALTKTTTKSLTSTTTPTGSLTKTVKKSLVGTVTPVGTLAKTIFKVFTGLVTPTGTLSTSIPTATDISADVTVTLTPLTDITVSMSTTCHVYLDLSPY